MSLQGIMRIEPPVCHGNGGNTDGNEHCCYVDGEVCPLLRIDDPRAADGRKYSCGLLLDLKEQLPNQSFANLWTRVHRHPLYAQIKAKFEASGTTLCGDFLGLTLPDGTIQGQCCFAGYTFDADGNVISGP